jgi:hypothetical protein
MQPLGACAGVKANGFDHGSEKPQKNHLMSPTKEVTNLAKKINICR